MDNKSLFRENNYDLMRIICSVCVVMIHVNAGWLFNDVTNSSTFDYKFQSILNIITRFSVQCFIMLSGAFNISNPKNCDISLFYKKSLKKLLPPLIIVNIFWIVQMMFNGENTPVTIVLRVIKMDYGNLWFMPMLIGLYAMTPLIVRCIKLFTRKELFVFILILGGWACVSQYSAVHLLPYDNGNVMSYLFYYIIGYYIYTNDSFKLFQSKTMFIVFVICAFLFAWGGVWGRNRLGITLFDINPYVSFFSPIVITISIVTMILFKNMIVKRNFKVLASLTYCVYLFHTPIIFFYKKFMITRISMPEALHVVFEWIIVTVFSFFASWLYVNIEKRLNTIKI